MGNVIWIDLWKEAIEKSELFTNCLQQVQMEKSLNWIRIQGERLKSLEIPNALVFSLGQAPRYFKKVSHFLFEDMEARFTQIMPIWKWAIGTSYKSAELIWFMKLPLGKKSGLRQSISFWGQVIFMSRQALFCSHFGFTLSKWKLIPRRHRWDATNISVVFDGNRRWIILFHPRIFQSNWNSIGSEKQYFLWKAHLFRIQNLEEATVSCIGRQ